MTILCLCGEENHRKLLPEYARCFRSRGVEFLCVDSSVAFDTHLQEIVERCPREPSWIFHFESDFPLLPNGLVDSEIPTVCFQVDTYAFTKRRMRWSSLFDHVAVFHPGYEELLGRHGHGGAFLLPHAVRRDLYEQPELPREYEVGWVGQTHGAFYRTREKWIPKLAQTFRMNDWQRAYSVEEMAGVYRRSRVVVNIGRDDFRQDANMRAFEALASGALLVTALPSELTGLGFQEGMHFVGYRAEGEIPSLVREFLRDERAWFRIAQAAREKVLREHTYDCRVERILERLGQFGRRKLAPARSWGEARVRLTHLDFFAAHGVLDCAETQFRQLAGRGFRETIEGAALLVKARLKALQARLESAA